MKNFRDLKVWQKSHSLTLDVYRITKRFPADELYGLTSQLRRAALSIGSNIAEGCGRGSDSDFCRFLQMAMGSASEVEYQLLLGHDLGYVQPNVYQPLHRLATEIKRMLAALLATLKKNSN